MSETTRYRFFLSSISPLAKIERTRHVVGRRGGFNKEPEQPREISSRNKGQKKTSRFFRKALVSFSLHCFFK